jgi:hypothetical protein
MNNPSSNSVLPMKQQQTIFRPCQSSPREFKSCSSRSFQSPSRSFRNCRGLCFGNIEIYEFRTVIGDNPQVSEGCPVALDAEGKKLNTIPVQLYERSRGKRRPIDELKLGVSDRNQRLIDAGYSITEIADGTTNAMHAKQRRQATNRKRRWDGVNAFVENTCRGLKKIIRIPKKRI